MADALNELRGMLTDDLPVRPVARGPRPVVCAAAAAILTLAAVYAYQQQQRQPPVNDDPLFQPF